VRRRIILAVTIAAALFGVVAAPALAQKPESAPAAAALMKSKPKTPAGGTVTVKVTNWREADLAELQVVESGSANWKKVLGALGLARRRATARAKSADVRRLAAKGMTREAPCGATQDRRRHGFAGQSSK
jgi:hypothetical protein